MTRDCTSSACSITVLCTLQRKDKTFSNNVIVEAPHSVPAFVASRIEYSEINFFRIKTKNSCGKLFLDFLSASCF